MQLNCRTIYVPKAGSTIEQYEDASAYYYSIDPAIAAVSDGAGTTFESGLWARLLAKRFVELPLSGQDQREVLDWVSHASAAWHASIPWQDLSFFAKEKASQGSAATLVGLRLEESEPGVRYGTWSCMAMGDSCMFQVRDGHLATAIPLRKSADFVSRSSLFYTRRDLSEREISKLVTSQGTWRDGDSFFLLTDAIAEWFLREFEHGLQPWETLAAQDERSLGLFVDERRDRRLIRNDDVTVVILDILTAWRPSQRPQPPKRDLTVDSTGRMDRIEGHAFISYVREDSRQVDRLQEALEAAGVRVWRDTADLWPGEDWRVKIRRAITDNSLVFVACFSRKSVSRHKSYQNEELTLAMEQMRLRSPDDPWLIPVRSDECEIPDREIGAGRTLSSINRADLFGDRADVETERLVAFILRKLTRR